MKPGATLVYAHLDPRHPSKLEADGTDGGTVYERPPRINLPLRRRPRRVDGVSRAVPDRGAGQTGRGHRWPSDDQRWRRVRNARRGEAVGSGKLLGEPSRSPARSRSPWRWAGTCTGSVRGGSSRRRSIGAIAGPGGDGTSVVRSPVRGWSRGFQWSQGNRPPTPSPGMASSRRSCRSGCSCARGITCRAFSRSARSRLLVVGVIVANPTLRSADG